jgi:hypothetical protein
MEPRRSPKSGHSAQPAARCTQWNQWADRFPHQKLPPPTSSPIDYTPFRAGRTLWQRLLIPWKGGVHTPLRARTPQRSKFAPHLEGHRPGGASAYAYLQIAGVLNRAKLLTGQGNFWTRALVTAPRHNRGIDRHDSKRQAAEVGLISPKRLDSLASRILNFVLGCRKEVSASGRSRRTESPAVCWHSF